MERLSGLDATFLYIETPAHHMHVSMVAVFDPSTVAGGYSFDKVRDLIESRLPRIAQFRRRLVRVPFDLHHPVWVEDPDFDLDYHVRRVGVPSPGTLRELCDIAGDFTSRPLDRSKPLWELVVAEGLEGGQVGLLAKVHHSTIDGVSGAELMVHLFDLEPEPAPQEEPQPKPAERIPTDAELVAYAMRSRARQPLLFARALRGTARSLTNLVRVRRQGEGPGMAAPFTAPRTSFNGSITPHRKVAVANLSLPEIKEVKRSFGTTVNDVVLAICSGALRRYLIRRGELPATPLVAVCPVSVRSQLPEAEGSNQVSAFFTSLATDVSDPVGRLRAIASATRGAKEEHNAIGADMLQNWAEFAAPAVFARASRLYSGMKLADRHRPIHNLVISNVPGPAFPLYLAGARLAMFCPLGPVMEGAGLNITVMSYMDSVDVGLIACRELMPDLWDLANDFVDSMDELKKAAAAQTGETRAAASAQP
jgi:WS/DGAT/MGAT family acyltransferase